MTSAIDMSRETPTTDAYAMLIRVALQEAVEADRKQSLGHETANAISQSGFAAHFVPKAMRGRQSTFTELMNAVTHVGHACTSAAWCAAIHAVCARMAAYLPTKAQSEIWGKDANALVSASFRPSGFVVADADGWKLSGQWHYLSGVEHAKWLLLCFSPSGDGALARYGLVEAKDCAVLRDWDTLGMRGTGSHSVELSNIFVPAYRTFPKSDLWEGKSAFSTGPQYEITPLAADSQLFVAAALGSANAIIERAAIEQERAIAADDYLAASFATSEGELDSAGLLIERACAACDGGTMSKLGIYRNARDASVAASFIMSAIHRIYSQSGSHAYFENHESLRRWRDIQTLVSHVALKPNFNLKQYGKIAHSSQTVRDLRTSS